MFGRQTPGLIAHQPHRRSIQLAAGGQLVQAVGTAAIGGEHLESLVPEEIQGVGQVRTGDHRQVEDRADRGPDHLGIGHLDRVGGEHHRIGTEGVGAADHGSGVAGVANLGADHDQLRLRGQLVQGALAGLADRDDSLWVLGFGDPSQFGGGDLVRPDAGAAGGGEQRFDPLVVGDVEQLTDPAGFAQRLPDRLRPLGQEQPGGQSLLALQQPSSRPEPTNGS